MKVIQVHDKALALPLEADSGDPETSASLTGGLESYLASLAVGLAARGWTVGEIRFEDAPASDAARVGTRRYVMRSSGVRRRRSIARRLEQIVRTEQPDLVHLHSIHYAMNPEMMRRLTRLCPVILTQHDVTPICYWRTKLQPDGRLCEVPVGRRCVTGGCYTLGAVAPLMKDCIRVLSNRRQLESYRQLRRIVVPSGYLREQFLINGFSPAQLSVVPLFSRYPVEPLGTSTGREILFIGRLVPEKGVDSLLDALSRLRAVGWRGSIVGDGPRLPALRAAAVRRGLDPALTFFGQRNSTQVGDHYRRAAVVVMPSLIPESFGLVGVEAMAFGKPVVAYRSGGITEWLESGVTGLIANHGDSAELAAHIDRVLTSPELQSAYGEAGRAAVRDRFNVATHLDAIEMEYRRCIFNSTDNANDLSKNC